MDGAGTTCQLHLNSIQAERCPGRDSRWGRGGEPRSPAQPESRIRFALEPRVERMDQVPGGFWQHLAHLHGRCGDRAQHPAPVLQGESVHRRRQLRRPVHRGHTLCPLHQRLGLVRRDDLRHRPLDDVRRRGLRRHDRDRPQRDRLRQVDPGCLLRHRSGDGPRPGGLLRQLRLAVTGLRRGGRRRALARPGIRALVFYPILDARQ